MAGRAGCNRARPTYAVRYRGPTSSRRLRRLGKPAFNHIPTQERAPARRRRLLPRRSDTLAADRRECSSLAWGSGTFVGVPYDVDTLSAAVRAARARARLKEKQSLRPP